MKHNLDIGDGIIGKSLTIEQSKHIHQLLEECEDIKMFTKTENREDIEFGYFYYYDGKYWLTCSDYNVKNPLTYEQILFKITNKEPLYEIY